MRLPEVTSAVEVTLPSAPTVSEGKALTGRAGLVEGHDLMKPAAMV